jgi:hypothetical protein
VTLSEIALLLRAFEREDEYDQFLLLDTDALMYDFETDATTLLSDEDMVAAQRVHTHDVKRTWDIMGHPQCWRHVLESLPSSFEKCDSLLETIGATNCGRR